MATRPSPVGVITRGTTNPNRLRRVDRWIVHAAGPALRSRARPLVVDLGFGASAVTTVELAQRLRGTVRPDVEVVGLEIDRARVAAAQPVAGPGISFELGGFEVPTARRPSVIRAMNVLRQYDEAEVPGAWARMAVRLAPGGLLVEGTCDEIGRRGTWVRVGADGVPVSLTLSLRLAGLDRPSDVADRLPKALIHRNVRGERIFDLLTSLDGAWDRAAGLGVFSPRQRWLAAVGQMRDTGIPVLDGPTRWRLGELTVPWDSVAPLP